MKIPQFSRLIWISLVLVPLLVAGVSTWLWRPQPPHLAPAPAPVARRNPPPALVPDPIDGEPVSGEIAVRRPIAVMIDNLSLARPQWGLSAAARVYEALTEGGITRYLAVFAEQDADRIGPVRSARTQFLDYAVELDAAIAHVGGNADALALVRELPVKDLDDFHFGDAYRRIPAPHVAFEHTAFTSTQTLRGILEQRGWAEDPPIAQPSWKDDRPVPDRPASQRVTIAFSTPEYTVSWTYRPETNDYARALAGAPDTDAATGHALTAKTIAIAVIPRTEGRTSIGEDTWTFADVGSGPALVVQDGTVIRATWQKASRADRLRFVDQTDHEIALNRGPQWIEIVPPEVTPTFEP